MNQGRIWCVVNPTVGLPLLLGGVAATSLIVHACVLTNTTWFGNYWQGGGKARAASNETAPVASVTPNATPAAPTQTASDDPAGRTGPLALAAPVDK